MRNCVCFFVSVFCLLSVRVEAKLSQDSNNPYHFTLNDNPNDHFFLIGKSAFRLVEVWQNNDQQAKDFIDDAKDNGINTLRIFLMWDNDGTYQGQGDDHFQLTSNPWTGQPADDSDWWDAFDDDTGGFFESLKALLVYMDNNNMEAELCLFEASVLWHINTSACVGPNSAYSYGETFLTTVEGTPTPNPSMTPNPSETPTPFVPLSEKTIEYIDHVIEKCGESGRSNWHIEIGNQINDPWERADNPPHWMTGSFLDWLNAVGDYIYGQTNHLVTNSSPSYDEIFAARNYTWNLPVSFHGDRTHVFWNVADYNDNYSEFRSFEIEKPLVNNEPDKYCPTQCPTPTTGIGNFYTDAKLAHWSFWTSAMAGSYQHYHSEWAYNIEGYGSEGADIGDDTIKAFYDIITQHDDWYLMTPDFLDILFLRDWNGKLFAGNLAADNIYPLLLLDGNNKVDKGYIYLWTGDIDPGLKCESDLPISDCLCYQPLLLESYFQDDSLYRFSWYNPSNSTPTPIAEVKPMHPETRFIYIPTSVNQWLDGTNGTRDALLYIEKIDGTMNIGSPELTLGLNQTVYHPGDRFDLYLARTNQNNFALYGEQYIVLEVLNQYYFWPDWTTDLKFLAWPLTTGTPTPIPILGFVWPDYDFGDIDPITFYAAILAPGTTDLIGELESVECSAHYHIPTGRSYYVDGGNGDDYTGDGSCHAPWETIQHALDNVPESSGERIDVHVAPYATPYPATSPSPITVPAHVSLIGSGPGETTIQGDGSTGLITLLDDSRISGFTIKNCDLISEADVVVADNEFMGSTQSSIIKCTNSQQGEPPEQLIMNNLFVDNSCSTVIYFSGNVAPRVIGCTIADNGYACGIYCDGDAGVAAEIRNNIIFSNVFGISLEEESDVPEISDNDIAENSTEDYDGLDEPSGNLSDDPLFVTGTYFLSQTTAGQGQNSPCVNAASRTVLPPFLCIGTTRIDGIMDRGAFDLGYHVRKMKTAVGFVDLNGDYYTESVLQFIDGAAPAEFIGLGSSDEIEVYINDGDENLTLSNQTFPSGTVDAKIEELTGDEYKDIAAAFDYAVKLYANDGDAYFDLSQTITCTPQVYVIALGKLDPEGCLDLFVGTADGTDVYVNDCEGEFTYDQHLDGDDIAFFACGDLDGDDDIDLVTANASGSNQIWLNDGGDFEEGQLIETESTSAISLEYVNGDAVLDLVINVDDCTTETYYGDNEGGFKQFTYIVPWFTTDVYAGQYWNTKVVLKNAGGFDGHAAFTYYDESGDEIADTKELLTVDGHGVVVRDLEEVASDTFGSVEITTDYETEGVVIYTYHNTNDTDHAMYSVPLQSTDELSADPQAPWYLSTTWSSDYSFGTIDSFSSIYLKNPTDDTVELTITYYYPDGTTADVDSSIEIDPHGVYSASMYWSMPSDAGSCEVEADGSLMGQVARCYTNTTTGEKFMHAEKLQHTEFAGTTMTTPYYLSYVDEDWYWESWFSVKNPWGDEVTATITYYDDDGDTVQTDNVSLDAHSTTMYGIIEGDPSVVGSVSISASDIVIGHKEIFGADLTNEKLCIGSESLDCPEAGVLNYVIPWFESYDTEDVSVGTWITFQNPNGTTATIDLTYYDTDGQELIFTPSQIELDAHALQTIDLTEGDPDDYGSIEITSDLLVMLT